jgi:hypothetical protein
MFTEPPRIVGAQLAEAEPALTEHMHRVVMIFGDAVVCLERLQPSERGPRLWMCRRPEAWEQALFLVRGVTRRGGPEVLQGRREGVPV